MNTQAFNYDITQFSFKGEQINSNYIKYIIVDSFYESKTMAAMYVALHVPNELYQDIIDSENSEDGFMNVTIRSKNVYSDTSIADDYIKGKFAYVLPSSNPDYSVNLSEDIGSSYRPIILSLLQQDYLDKLKTSICGTYCNIDIQDLLRLALKDMKNVIVQTPTVENLKKFDKVVIPPMNSMKKMVDYLYNLKPFYNTAYTFFADFNNVFLIAHDKDTSAAIGAVSRVVFHICSVTNDNAYIEGVVTGNMSSREDYVDGDTYHIYVNPADVSVSPNKALDKISNQIMAIQEDGTVTEPIQLDYGVLGATSSNLSKLAVRRGANIDIYANMLNSNTVTVEIKKSHINGAIISPDKVVSVSFELSDDKQDFNSRYTGDYYITYKREYIRNNSGTFGVSCTIGLKLIGNLKSVTDTSEISAGGAYTSRDSANGTRVYNNGSRISQTAKSATNASKTQSKVARVSGSGGRYSVSIPMRSSNSLNPYNLKSSSYSGPKYIEDSSAGAVRTLDPHMNERKL